MANAALQGYGDTSETSDTVTDLPLLQQAAVLVPLALLWNTRGAVVCSSVTIKSVFFFSISMSSTMFIGTKTTLQRISF